MPMTPVEVIYGPTLLGIMLNVLLYGIMTTQTYLYIVTFKQDKRWMKYFVYFLFFADTLNTGFDVAFLYSRLIHDFGNVPAVMVADWVFNTDPAMTGIIAFAVQSFFAWRVKLLTGNIPLTILIIICSTVQMLSGIGTAIACSIVTQFIEFHKFQVIVILWLAFAALGDVIIAVSLVTHLRGQRTGFAATDDLINKITRMTVQTGAITALFATIDLITFLASTSGLHLAFNMPLAKLYTNSMLSTLNARALAQSGDNFASGGADRSGQRPLVQRHLSENPVGPKGAMDFEYTSGPNRASKIVMNTAASQLESHELDDVATQTGTRVFVNVEEVKDVV